MEKKTKIILAIGLTIAILIVAIMFIFLQDETETHVYTNKEIGFELTLPDGWKVFAEHEQGAAFEYQLENETYNLQLFVYINPSYSGKDLSTIVNETLESFSNTTNTGSNFTVDSYNQRIINGMDALEFNITGKYNSSTYSTKAKWLKVNNNAKYFDIIFEATPSFLFDEHADEIEQVINSFIII